MPDSDHSTSPQIVVPTPKTRSYRSCLIKLGRKFKKDDLNELKFALRGTIPEGKLDLVNHPLQLFIALEHLCLLGPDNFNTLRGYLNDIDRPNLIKILDEYDSSRAELVEARSDSKYSLTFVNQNDQRCKVNAVVNGYEMFIDGYVLLPKQTITIERPIRADDLQPGPGTQDDRSVIETIPDKTDIKITCVVASDTESQFMAGFGYSNEVVYNPWENYYPMNEYPTGPTCQTNYTDPVINFEALMKETEGLIKVCIGFRLRLRFKQSCLRGLSREILVPPNKPSNKAITLWRLAMALESQHEQLFQQIPSVLDFSESQAESTFYGIAKEVFSNNVFNWGRIVALITFTGAVAHHFVEQERPEMVSEVIQWLLQFMRIHLITWMIENGGWDGFVVFFNGSESCWQELFRSGQSQARLQDSQLALHLVLYGQTYERVLWNFDNSVSRHECNFLGNVLPGKQRLICEISQISESSGQRNSGKRV